MTNLFIHVRFLYFLVAMFESLSVEVINIFIIFIQKCLMFFYDITSSIIFKILLPAVFSQHIEILTLFNMAFVSHLLAKFFL